MWFANLIPNDLNANESSFCCFVFSCQVMNERNCGMWPIYNDWPWSLIRFNHNIKRVQSIIILIYNFTTEEETTTNCNYKCKSSFFCFFFGCRVMNARNCGMLLLYIMTDRSWSGSNHVPFNANCHHQNLHHNWSTQIRLVRPVTDRLRRSWAPHGHTLHLGKMLASWMAWPFSLLHGQADIT